MTNPFPVARPTRIATSALAVLLTALSIVGLVLGPRGLYADDPATAPAFLGQDMITLVVGVPMLLVAMRAALRGVVAGLIVWMGALFYVAYSYAFFVLDPRVTVLFPAYAIVVALSTYTLLALVVGAGADVVRRGLDIHRRIPRRAAIAYLFGMALLFTVMWGAMFGALVAADANPTTVEHIVWSLDVMFALPAMFIAAVLLWRRRAWGFLFAGMMLLKATFLGFTLLVTTWLAAFWSVPAPLIMTIAFALLGFAGLAITVSYLRAFTRASVNLGAPVAAAGAPAVPASASVSAI